MALTWRIRAVTPETAADGTGLWEPFAAAEHEGEPVVLVKLLAEDEEGNAKSSFHPENQPIWTP
jgi:hypothetical protein